ncbi:MAG: hypothetical protein ABIY37_05360 [Devosia sp.]
MEFVQAQLNDVPERDGHRFGRIKFALSANDHATKVRGAGRLSH